MTEKTSLNYAVMFGRDHGARAGAWANCLGVLATTGHFALEKWRLTPDPLRISNAKGRKLETSQTRYYVPERPTAGLARKDRLVTTA